MDDQAPAKPQRKRGPKTELAPCEALTRVNLMVDEMTVRKLKVMGEGNASAGVRLAVKIAFERFRDPKRRA